jgi:hypothetical protein
MRDKLNSVKNHVVKHRFKYGVATGLTAGMYLCYRSAAVHNEFLKEHGLYDEFYTHEVQS